MNRNHALLGFLFLLPLLSLNPPRGDASPEIVRGPYLQMGTNTSGVVRWRTNEATSSRVVLRAPGDAIDREVVESGPTTEHIVEIDGLVPGTSYTYDVGTSTEILTPPDPERELRTAPNPGDRSPFRAWVIGDSGTADGNARAVRDAFRSYAGETPADLWLMLGDNAYADGTDAEYQAAVFETYPDLLQSTWLWPAFGNHDSRSADSSTQTGPYFEIFSLPTQAEAGGVASGTEAWYSFDWANVHFVCLDPSGSQLDVDGPMLQWLANDVNTTEQEWIVAFWHHPPYSHGSHDSDDPNDSGGRLFDIRENALPILENAGVDLVLSGHSHSYERSYLLHGHYGTSDSLTAEMVLDAGDGHPHGDGPYRKHDHRGAVYTVAGSSGKVTVAPLDHPAMFTSLPELGSVVLDVAGSRMDVVFVSSTGTALDTYRLEKANLFADGFESGDLAAWSF